MRDGTVTALEDVPVMDCLLLWMNVNIAPLLFCYGFSGSFRCAPEPDATRIFQSPMGHNQGDISARVRQLVHCPANLRPNHHLSQRGAMHF